MAPGQIEAMQCDYCGLKLRSPYVWWQRVEICDGREQVEDYALTYRFCDNDCLTRWIARGLSRQAANFNLEFAGIAKNA